MRNVTSLAEHRPGAKPIIFFDRTELGQILNVYGQMVAKGEWRDYAMDGGKEQALFSVFRRSSEMPIYRIVKCPKWAKRQGAYAIMGTGGQILRRGHDLGHLLRFFDRKRFQVVD